MLIRLLVSLVDFSRRQALSVVLAGILLAGFSGWFAATHLGVSTDTAGISAARLPGRPGAREGAKVSPHSKTRWVGVVGARPPGEADAPANELARRLKADPVNFPSVRRP